MMDVQTAPPTYTPIGGARPPVGNPPMLGQQVPGMSGGLPAQGGLSVTANPMAQSLQSQTPDTQAQQLQSYGRGDDSMLVHMTPNEVNSLQGLALATGGSLTINPDTGLPEAGWLGKLLPTILGAALAATGVGAPLAAGIVGAGQFARTGSLKKGLMAGLGAFGGAGMAGMAGLGGSLSQTGFGTLSNNAGFFGANMGQGISQGANAVSELAKLGTAPVENAINVTAKGAVTGAPSGYAGPLTDKVISTSGIGSGLGSGTVNAANRAALLSGGPIGTGTGAALTGVAPTTTAIKGAQFTGGLGSRFGQAVRSGLPAGTPGIIAKNAPMIAGIGALSNISDASQPTMRKYNPDEEGYQFKYEGPYRTIPRKFDPTVEGEGEIQFFDEVNPVGYLTASGERRGYAEGGEAKKESKNWGAEAAKIVGGLVWDKTAAETRKKQEEAIANYDFSKKVAADQRTSLLDWAADPRAYRAMTGLDMYATKENPERFDTGISGAWDMDGQSYEQRNKGSYAGATNIFRDREGVSQVFGYDDTGRRTYLGTEDEYLKSKVTAPAIDDKPRVSFPQPDTGGGGGVKPPEDKISVDTLGTTIDPTKGGVTPGTGTGATLTDRPDIPGATYDSPGVQTLKDLYTPKFTQKDDFVTAKRDPYTMGSELSAKLPEATARYQTSPGAVTASRTYAGGSPSERIRAAAQANAAARAAAAAAAAAGTTTPSTTTPASTTPGTGGELDFGIPKTTSTAGPANTAGPASDRGYTGLSGNNPYMNIYNQQTNQQPNLNAGNVMDTGNVGGEMDFGFGFGPPAQGQTNPNVNLASLIGTDAFFEELSKRYGGGGGGNAEYGMPNNQVLAAGGPVNMHNGAFVVDARTVSELGNGSSNAGIELLQRLGGQPVRGRGDGVSDSVPARIGGKQEARVARDEVIFQPKAVKRLGGGSAKRGTQKLYAMMEKAHKARKRAGRGQDTKLAKGLGA